MTSPSTDGNDRTEAEEDPVYLTLESDLRSRYPNWRKTTHYAPTGQKVMMIEFADNQGEFVTGLPSDFVSMVAEAYPRTDDTGTDR